MAEIQSWETMRRQIREQLQRQTGRDVASWRARIAGSGAADEGALRSWLDSEGIIGYPQSLLVWETFGYPDFLVASADELVDAQYADRGELRPILTAVLGAAGGLGDVAVQARKTYVSLLTPRRTFAAVRATTRSRVDLGLRLDGIGAQGRLLPARGVGSDTITLRIGLERVEDIDDECLAWLRRAYDESR